MRVSTRCGLRKRNAEVTKGGPLQAALLFCSGNDYTASDSELNVNSRTLIAGMMVAPPAPRASDALMRIDGPSISRLFRKKIGDSLKRKFFTGRDSLPFSMR